MVAPRWLGLAFLSQKVIINLLDSAITRGKWSSSCRTIEDSILFINYILFPTIPILSTTYKLDKYAFCDICHNLNTDFFLKFSSYKFILHI